MPPNTTQVIDSEGRFPSAALWQMSFGGNLSHQRSTDSQSRNRLSSGCPARLALAPVYICPRGTRFEVQR